VANIDSRAFDFVCCGFVRFLCAFRGLMMKSVFLLFTISVLVGCSGSEFQLTPVSGTVTFDGTPLEGADVVFAPMESEGVIDVGPISIGTTDANGKYSLQTARGSDTGAVVAKHRVSIGYKGIDSAVVARQVEAAYAKNPNMSERAVNALENKIRQSLREELKGQVDVPKSYNKNTRLKFEVSGPTDDADFALNSDGSIADH